MKKLNLESMIDEPLKAYMSKGEEFSGHQQLIFRFQNHYGASVVYGPGTYEVELAKIFFTGAEDMDFDVTEEPFGWLEKDELNKLLNEIKWEAETV